MGLIDEVGEGPAALDTLAFIYWIEENRDYLDIVASIFRAADDGDSGIRWSTVCSHRTQG